MANEHMKDQHRPWEDWTSIGIGVLIVLSPYLADQTNSQAIVVNAAAVGTGIAVLGVLELMRLHRLEEIALLACGLWLSVSPYIYGYGGTLASWHVALGAIVTLLAALELWQDWGRADKDMAQHGMAGRSARWPPMG